MTYVYDSNDSDEYESQTAPDPVTLKLLATAQEVYMSYYQAHGENALAPLGVVVDRKTFRGHLIFTGQPILLPQESFIPTEQLTYEPVDDNYWQAP